MQSNSTAKAIIRVRGPDITYGVIKMTPKIDSRAGSIDVSSFTVRRGDDRFQLSELPLSRVLPTSAQDDILSFTFEEDEDILEPFLEIEFEIPEYDESAKMRFRAVVRPENPDMVYFEVEGPGEQWMGLDDVYFIEMLSDTFMRVLETSVIESISDHDLAYLPMSDES